MSYPIKICSVCSEEFELKPDKPGFANRCPACSEGDQGSDQGVDSTNRNSDHALNAERRKAMRDLLYRKDS